MKAKVLLQKNKTVDERAESFISSIKRNIQKNLIDTLIAKKDKLTDEIFELSDFTLSTNLNSGQSAISRDKAEERFVLIIEKEYELTLLELELKTKQESFDKYFADETPATN